MSGRALLFEPEWASTEELEKLCVGREGLLQGLEEQLNQQREGGTTQHFLLLGASGSGKTYLTELLSRRLETNLSLPWRVIRLPEGGQGLSRLDELLASLVARDRGQLEEEAPPPAALSLDALSQRNGPPLVVILEDLPRLLKHTLRGIQEVRQLRSILMNNPPFTMLGTAERYFAEVSREDQPFYDFFKVYTLPEWSDEEADSLIDRLAERDSLSVGTPERQILQRRAQALRHITGKNPRVLCGIYETIRQRPEGDIYLQLLEILDRFAPVYRARLHALSDQQSLLLTRLATAPGPLEAAQLARRARLPTAHTTAILTVLLVEGLVRRIGEQESPRYRYIVGDRLFQIWLEARLHPESLKNLKMSL